MGLKAYTSTSLKNLARKLSEETKENNKSVFQPDFVVTPNNGLKKWLKVEIAEQNGIAANIQFLQMSQIASIIYRILGGKEEKKEVLSVLQLQWMLFDLMGRADFKKQFPLIAAYSGTEFQKRFALAGKVAVLFNKYQTFIPEKISDWKNNTDSLNENELWQEFLWTNLKNSIKDSFYTDIDSYEYIETKLKDALAVEELIKKLPVISIFNLNDLSAANIDLLFKISEFIQVNIYFFSPLPSLDFENLSNSLLKNWIGNQKTVLQNLRSRKIDITTIAGSSGEEPVTLLQKIQLDIKSDSDKSILTKENLKDESLIINSCFTANREVEVLYNFLVKTVTQGSSNSIGAKDIAVFCSDINKYSSSIKAVFDTAPYKFPYHIMDDSVSDTASPLLALESLLSIDTRWFKPEEVMHLLEYPAIRDRFEIKDVTMLRDLVNGANIRNGYTGEKVNETNLISWEHGLKRLMLGLCLSGEESFQQNGESYLLIDKTEGSTGYDLIRFRFFIKSLKENLENLSQPKKLEDWVEFVRTSIEFFLDTNSDIRMQELDRELANLLMVKDKVSEVIPLNTFFASLREILGGISSESSGLKRGITFCSTMPSRSVPFKIIALLGMNYDTFPRKTTNLSFDLLLNTEAAKMQDPKEKDKFFFLETLLAAENNLYLSFIGKDAKNNKERPPSSLIDELIDYIRVRYIGDRTKFTLKTEHPLHSFDSKYFDDALPELYTYLGKNGNLPAANIFRDSVPPIPEPDYIEVPIFKFVNFIKDPFKYYYNNTLGIYYRDEEELLSDEELFDLDTLQAWGIKNKLIRSEDLVVKNESRLEVVEDGQLPLSSLGVVLLNEINGETKKAQDRFLSITNGIKEEEYRLKLPKIEGILLTGTIGGIYGDKFIFNNVSKGEDKYRIAAFLQCLTLNASGNHVDLLYNSINNKSNVCKEIKSSDFRTKEANQLLSSLLKLLSDGSKKIVSFYPDMLKVLPDLIANPNDQEEIINVALDGNEYLSEYARIEWENNFFADMAKRDELVKNLKLINDHILLKFN